jgi:hypothetical protein
MCWVLILPLVHYYICTDSTIIYRTLCQTYSKAMKKREMVWRHSDCYINLKSVVKRPKAFMLFWYWHKYRRNFKNFLTTYKKHFNFPHSSETKVNSIKVLWNGKWILNLVNAKLSCDDYWKPMMLPVFVQVENKGKVQSDIIFDNLRRINFHK